MCGIVGAACSRGVSNHDWLRAGLLEIQHRGPDDSGVWASSDRKAVFGHRRLAIVDLSPSGHQPMLSADGQLALIFNGEIYNFRELRTELQAKGHIFRSTSDTEVMLAAYRQWGENFLDRLHGMFAFALYDCANGLVLLARDRAGEKPLYYTRAESGELRFASELKALLVDPGLSRHIDLTAFDCFMALGYIPADHCILNGFNKLPPAHVLRLDLTTGVMGTRRYWSPPEFADSGAGDDELVEELHRLLRASVARQLEADVPVGVLLSGGVDSSLVTALAAESGRKISTYTVGFAGEPEIDESAHAALVARHFGTDHTVLQAGDMTPDLMGVLARQYDEPIAGSSMMPTYLLSTLIRRNCKVALGGDGGDELFGGYLSASRMASLDRWLSIIPQGARDLAAGVGERLPAGTKGRALLTSLRMRPELDLPVFSGLLDVRQRASLMRGQNRWRAVAEEVRQNRIPMNRDAVQRVTRYDFLNYMPDQVLVKVDRASMLSSLEIRAPMLDVEVMEFAFGCVPSRLKATRSERKIILKKLARRLLPADFDRDRKQGFGTPLTQLFRAGPWRDLAEAVLLDPVASFDRDAVVSLLSAHDAGRTMKEPLFALVLFELWRREYGATF